MAYHFSKNIIPLKSYISYKNVTKLKGYRKFILLRK